MPLGELAEQVIGGVLEFIGEVVIRWPGKQLCRLFRRDIELDSSWALWAGLLFWLALGYGIWMLSGHT